MEVLVALLALIGLAALVLIALAWFSEETDKPTSEEDLAAPYREGLRAAVRLQVVAQDLERQMYVEAARHLGSEPDTQDGGRP